MQVDAEEVRGGLRSSGRSHRGISVRNAVYESVKNKGQLEYYRRVSVEQTRNRKLRYEPKPCPSNLCNSCVLNKFKHSFTNESRKFKPQPSPANRSNQQLKLGFKGSKELKKTYGLAKSLRNFKKNYITRNLETNNTLANGPSLMKMRNYVPAYFPCAPHRNDIICYNTNELLKLISRTKDSFC